ncbi:MAG: hypothetical protein Q3M30_17970 [Candidatus Electrothrix sp. Rat3]|nr:hypothetical protein [Candidatus Electrothrix rattekaaiensis]
MNAIEEIHENHLKILLEEYAEAGRACRWYEQLTRIMITIFIVVQAPVLGFIQDKGLLNPTLIPLEILIVFLGSIVSINLSRIRKFFTEYRNRSIEIERILGMSLYTSGAEFVHNNSIWSQSFANYWLMILIPSAFAVSNFILIILQILSLFSK